MIKPITPNEVDDRKADTIPDEVIKVFNQEIANNWNGTSSTILQKNIASIISDLLEISISQVYTSKYLDIEYVYRKAGWDVVYDKPGYNESYEPTFVFRKMKEKS